MRQMDKQEFRLQNLSCANCAAKFEKNVSELPNVEEVQLNFGASKLTIVGEASIEQLEEAGAFDGIRVRPAGVSVALVRDPFYKKRENVLASISLLFVILGYALGYLVGEENLLTISMYIVAIVVGGLGMYH